MRLKFSILFLALILTYACNRKSTPAVSTPSYEYSHALEDHNISASANEMKADLKQWELKKISDQEWLERLDLFLEQPSSDDKEIDCFWKEYALFPTLDRYLLPTYRATGESIYQEAILKYLVDLDRCRSLAELEVQSQCLIEISKGGYAYPGLNKRMIERLKEYQAKAKQKITAEQIDALIREIRAI